MPFTFAHPAIVMPLLKPRIRQYFSATGLIVGSMAPDFESFIRMGRYKYYSHHWSGVLWFDVPLALLIALTFHYLVRDVLIEHLPASLRGRFHRWHGFNFTAYVKRHYVTLLLSLLIGVCSHLLWDAATHLNMSRPDSIRSRIMFGHFRVYILMQYAFSVIGLAVMTMYVRRLPVANVAPRKPIAGYWLLVLLVAAALETAVILLAPHRRINWLFLTNVTIGCLLFGLTVVSAVKLATGSKLTHS